MAVNDGRANSSDGAVESLRREVLALRRQLFIAIAGLVVAVTAGGVWMDRRTDRRFLVRRADTIYARRFVVEDQGRVAGEFGMYPGTPLAQLIVGTSDEPDHRVVIGMGQVNVISGQQRATLMGNSFIMGRENGPGLAFGNNTDSTWWLTGNVVQRWRGAPASRPPIDSILASAFAPTLRTAEDSVRFGKWSRVRTSPTAR